MRIAGDEFGQRRLAHRNRSIRWLSRSTPDLPVPKAAEMSVGDLDAFAPELVVASAGYDAHKDDPLGNQPWGDDDYGWWFTSSKSLRTAMPKGA